MSAKANSVADTFCFASYSLCNSTISIHYPLVCHKSKWFFCSHVPPEDEENLAKYIATIAQSGSWQSRTSVMALSAIYNTPVRTIYPAIQYLDLPDDWQALFGRSVSQSKSPITTILFTGALFNHFVPLGEHDQTVRQVVIILQ